MTKDFCTKTIKVGDQVLIDVLENGTYTPFTFAAIEGEEEPCWVFNGTGVYFFYPEVDECPACKTIHE